MRKKIILTTIILVVVLAGFAAWKFYGPAVSTSGGEFFYIKTGSEYTDVKQALLSKKYINSGIWFDWASKLLRYKTVRPGRYKLKKGLSIFSLVRMFRSGNQAQVNLVITKLRTKEDLARKAGTLFECDSIQLIGFLNNVDSISKYGLDTNGLMAVVMPFTYTLNWNSGPGRIFQNFFTAYNNFWTPERKLKADSLHLNPIQISTLASIVEEETLKKEDKYNIASVYMNRIAAGMPLQADPTVKFALKDFGLKRVLAVHLKTVSPYNTYLHTGLPPGPICTPSIETIDAVLDAPRTSYLYFVASSNFDGSSIFTSNLADHMKYARKYQKALTRLLDSLKKVKPE